MSTMLALWLSAAGTFVVIIGTLAIALVAGGKRRE